MLCQTFFTVACLMFIGLVFGLLKLAAFGLAVLIAGGTAAVVAFFLFLAIGFQLSKELTPKPRT